MQLKLTDQKKNPQDTFMRELHELQAHSLCLCVLDTAVLSVKFYMLVDQEINCRVPNTKCLDAMSARPLRSWTRDGLTGISVPFEKYLIIFTAKHRFGVTVQSGNQIRHRHKIIYDLISNRWQCIGTSLMLHMSLMMWLVFSFVFYFKRIQNKYSKSNSSGNSSRLTCEIFSDPKFLLNQGVIYDTKDHVNDYDPKLEPKTSIEFVIGLRWFHTMQDGRFK